MHEDEKKVRDAWEQIEEPDPYTVLLKVSAAQSHCFCGLKHRWELAAAFTDERKKQIAEIDEEIAVIEDGCALCDGAIGPGLLANSKVGAAYKRTLSRLQAARAELRRGMRGEA